MQELGPQERRSAGQARLRILRIVAFVLFVLAAAGFGLDRASRSPAVCTSCHEMRVRAGSWHESGHASVVCVDCHTPVRPKWAVPVRLVDRAGLLVRDIIAHATRETDEPVDGRTTSGRPLEDEVCLQCHTANRRATSGLRITIDHAKHAAANGSCVSCHVRTAHPVDTRGKELTFMAQCFVCHGSSDTPRASARCELCHPADFELKPASHRSRDWHGGRHGALAAQDVALCEMCHNRRACDACHGLEMPHPVGWEKGSTGHGVRARLNPGVCTRCHSGEPDMCTMCHHAKYRPEIGTWISQHPLQVKEDGASRCLQCHSPVSCVDCHTRLRR